MESAKKNLKLIRRIYALRDNNLIQHMRTTHDIFSVMATDYMFIWGKRTRRYFKYTRRIRHNNLGARYFYWYKHVAEYRYCFYNFGMLSFNRKNIGDTAVRLRNKVFIRWARLRRSSRYTRWRARKRRYSGYKKKNYKVFLDKYFNYNALVSSMRGRLWGQQNLLQSNASRKYEDSLYRNLFTFYGLGLNLHNLTNYKKLTYNILCAREDIFQPEATFSVEYLRADVALSWRRDFKSEAFLAMSALVNTRVGINKLISARNLEKDATLITDPQPVRGSWIDKKILPMPTYKTMLFTTQINKIQLVPGYQTLFRSWRRDYILMKGLKIRYQYRLTRYLNRYRKLTNMARLQIETLGLKLLLVFVHYFNSIAEARYAIRLGIFYINGIVVTMPDFQVQSGDYIQCNVTCAMYARMVENYYSRAQIIKSGVSILTHMRAQKGQPYDGRIVGDKLATAFFDRLRLNRILRVYYVLFDIPRYVECDYLTLSFIVLYEPRNLADYDYLVVRHAAIGAMKMLRWKYIT